MVKLLFWQFASFSHQSGMFSFIVVWQLTFSSVYLLLTNFLCVQHPCHMFAFQVENSEYFSTVFIARKNTRAEVIKRRVLLSGCLAALWNPLLVPESISFFCCSSCHVLRAVLLVILKILAETLREKKNQGRGWVPCAERIPSRWF